MSKFVITTALALVLAGGAYAQGHHGGGGGGGGGAGWMPTFVLIDTSSAAVSYTLPATPTNNEEIILKDNGHAEINNITVQGGSFPIDGQPTFLMRHNWASYGFWYLSGQWYVV